MTSHAEYIYDRYTSGLLRNPKLGKLCGEAATSTEHSYGKNVWVFPDQSKIVAIGRGPLRVVKVIPPPEKELIDLSSLTPTQLLDREGALYAVRVIKLTSTGHYEELFIGMSRYKGVSVAKGKEIIRTSDTTSVELMTLKLEKQVRL